MGEATDRNWREGRVIAADRPRQHPHSRGTMRGTTGSSRRIRNAVASRTSRTRVVPWPPHPRGHQFQRELTAEGRHLQPAASWDSKKNPSAKWHEALHAPVSLSPVRLQALPRGAGRRPAGSGRRGRPSPGWTSARVVWRRRQWALFGNRDFESMRPLDRTVLGA